MKKKTHPEDRMLADLIASSSEFSAYLRVGPHEKYVERGFASYAAARKRADALVAEHSRFGRGGLVYAITPQGYSVPCSPELIALAGVE